MRSRSLITTDNSVQCDGHGWVRLSDPGIAPGDPAISASTAAQVPGPGLRSVGGGTGDGTDVTYYLLENIPPELSPYYGSSDAEICDEYRWFHGEREYE